MAAVLFVVLRSTFGADETNTVSHLRYRERLIRRVTFVAPGPAVVLADHGEFTLKATLKTPGIDFTNISETTRVEFEFSAEDAQFATTVELGNDPNYSRGDIMALITRQETFGGKDHRIENVTIKMDPETQSLRSVIHGRYLAVTLAPDHPGEMAGSAVLADEKIGSMSHRVLQGGNLTIRLTVAENSMAAGTSGVVITGKVRRALRHHGKAGTYPAYKIVLAGAGSRP